MKAHFDYNPKTDQHLPCPEAGLAFNRGAVLFILNQDDPEWWQVSKCYWTTRNILNAE